MSDDKNYTVLARKYRPAKLDGLIGQEALVRTLKNALKSGRLAHAFLLTGIRGVGKTSTARIIARELNEIPENEAVDSHIDVVEMDAASNTGVDNIREIIEAAKYKPLSAPYKIYIIDEVHMLSKGAFNALLKTLEEPPEHVKFIFATTEIRKVPVTILSRCQRFDLPRVDTSLIAEHLENIALKEKIKIENEAIRILANASEGSVRDSLSLLDQAIAHSDGKITLETVQQMLGFGDKVQILALFEALMGGKISDALEIFETIASTSAEPQQIIQDLLGFCHLVTRFKVTPNLEVNEATQQEVEKAQELAGKLTMSSLTFVWQMLLKAVEELRYAPNAKQAAEMVIVRISYSTELPDPKDLIKAPMPKGKGDKPSFGEGVKTDVYESPTTYAELVDLFARAGETLISTYLKTGVHLVSFAKEKLEIRLAEHVPANIPSKVTTCLREWTGKSWVVVVSNEEGQATLEQEENKKVEGLFAEAKQEPIVKKLFKYFPEAEVENVRELENKKTETRSN